MRLAFLCAGWPPAIGGIETHASELARGLARRGHTVEVLALDRSGARPAYELSEPRADPTGAAGVRVAHMACDWRDARSLSDLVARPGAEESLARWLDARVPELVHVHHLTGFGTGALRAIGARGLPCVLTLHDHWLWCPRGQMLHVDGSTCARAEPARCGACLRATWPELVPAGVDAAAEAQRRLERVLADLGEVERFVAPSRAVAELAARHGLPRARCVHVPNAVDAEALVPAFGRARARRTDDGCWHVGVLGALQPSKGVLELARALLATGIERLVLDLHGPLGDYHGDARQAEALRALAEAEPRIRLHGSAPRAELPRVLAGLDALSVPSRWEEVFGLGAREARAVGLPVLASAVGGLNELAPHPTHVRWVPARDERAWTAALRALFQDGPPPLAVDPGAVRALAELVGELEALYAGLRAVHALPASGP